MSFFPGHWVPLTHGMSMYIHYRLELTVNCLFHKRLTWTNQLQFGIFLSCLFQNRGIGLTTNPQRGRNGLLRAFSSIECELEHKRRWVLLPCFVSHCLEGPFVEVSVALSRACPPPQCCCRRFFCNTGIRIQEIAVVERFCCTAFAAVFQLFQVSHGQATTFSDAGSSSWQRDQLRL